MFDHELRSTPTTGGLNDVSPDGDQMSGLREFSLPPVGKGKDTWLCLAGGFVLEMMVWGFPFSFGVFQEYYSTTEPFAHNKSSVSIIGSCSMGILYLASPISLFILHRWPKVSRTGSLVGLAIAIIGIVSSGFANKLWQLIITQGVLYPVGAGMLYYPVLIFLDEWFVARKGLAYGLCWAGSGVGGIAFPFLLRFGLSRYSLKATMCAVAVAMVLIVSPFLPFVKPRIRVSGAQAARPQKISLRFLRCRTFLIFQLGSLLQNLGYFAPSLYLPTYSRDVLGESDFGTTIPLTLMNAGIVFGSVLIGHLIDRWHVADVIFSSTVSTIIGVFVVWGLSASLSPLCVFAIIYGIFAGSAASTWPGIVKAVKRADQKAPAGLMLGLLTASRGVGSIVCGPISEAVINADWPWTGKSSSLGFGTRFGGLIVFTGVTASFGALGFGARRLGVLGA